MRFSLIVVIILLGFTTLSAQWHGNGTQLSEACIRLQGLDYVPQLRTDMPLDCLIGYVVMDSVARTVGTFEATRYPENMVIPQLRIMSRYMYAMGDYDPILLNRHFFSTKDSNFPNERYQSYPANTYYPILMEINKRQDKFGRDYGILVSSNYVLRIRVIEAREGIDSTMFNRPSPPTTNVACEVLEIFKGQRLPENCRPIQANQQNTKHDHDKPLSQSNCLIYAYRTDDIESKPKPGDEIFLFLNLVIVKNDLFLVYPTFGFDKTGGRFLVQNGRVNDPDNIWGKGINPTFQDFRSTLLQRINDIRSWKQ